MPQSARIEELTKQAVISLNKIWDEDGWTNSAIVQELEKHKVSGSLSTIQRLRAEGAENKNYNYNNTIRPILRVFADIAETPVSVSDAVTPEEVQTATLQNTILMREADIKVLEAKLAEVQKQAEENRTAEERKIAHLNKQIEELNGILKDRKEFMADRKEFIFRLEAEKAALRRESNIKTGLLVLAFILMLIGYSTDALLPWF